MNVSRHEFVCYSTLKGSFQSVLFPRVVEETDVALSDWSVGLDYSPVAKWISFSECPIARQKVKWAFQVQGLEANCKYFHMDGMF